MRGVPHEFRIVQDFSDVLKVSLCIDTCKADVKEYTKVHLTSQDAEKQNKYEDGTVSSVIVYAAKRIITLRVFFPVTRTETRIAVKDKSDTGRASVWEVSRAPYVWVEDGNASLFGGNIPERSEARYLAKATLLRYNIPHTAVFPQTKPTRIFNLTPEGPERTVNLLDALDSSQFVNEWENALWMKRSDVKWQLSFKLIGLSDEFHIMQDPLDANNIIFCRNNCTDSKSWKMKMKILTSKQDLDQAMKSLFNRVEIIAFLNADTPLTELKVSHLPRIIWLNLFHVTRTVHHGEEDQIETVHYRNIRLFEDRNLFGSGNRITDEARLEKVTMLWYSIPTVQ